MAQSCEVIHIQLERMLAPRCVADIHVQTVVNSCRSVIQLVEGSLAGRSDGACGTVRMISLFEAQKLVQLGPAQMSKGPVGFK